MRSTLDTDFFDRPPPRVFAHRGASGRFPENTVAAFEAAIALGAPYLELDIHCSRDGEIVVHHDDDLRRTAGADQRISDLTLKELRAVDVAFNFTRDGQSFPFRGRGIAVPTLRDVLSSFPQQRLIVEIKQQTPSLVTALLGLLRDTGATRRVLIASEHQTPLDEVRAAASGIPTNLSAREIGAFMMALAPGAAPYHPSGDALQIPPEHLGWKLATPESVAAAHRLGLEVHVWTVNDPAEIRALLKMGVDGIISDFPDRALDAVVATR